MTDIRTYTDNLKFELDLANVSGANILADVEQHCADSGEDPVDAFGPAREYATRMADELGATRTDHDIAGVIVPSLLGFTGTVLASDGVGPLISGQPASLGYGTVTAVVLMGVFLMVFNLMAGWAMRRRTRLAIVGGITVGLWSLAWIGLNHVGSVEVPAWPLPLAAVVLGAAAFTLMRRSLPVEPIQDPRHPELADERRAEADRWHRRLSWLWPIAIAGVAVLTALPALFTLSG